MNLFLKVGSSRVLRTVLVALLLLVPGAAHKALAEEVTFEISTFIIEGSTLFDELQLMNLLTPFTGQAKTSEDVEQARTALERYHHTNGYPTVLVNIPEQTVEDGVVRLQVIETRIREVRVKGNRYHTREYILERLPSLGPGKVIFLPDLQGDLARLNSARDIEVTPAILPGREMDSLDVELEVKDSLPVHGSVELNNRSTHTTSELRVNASTSFDNLWQAGHSVSLQYQTAPLELREVQAVALSYVLPAPWRDDHFIAAYGVLSDSETAFGSGFSVIGEGLILGARYVMPLPSYEEYQHNLTAGLDYKDFQQSYTLAPGESLDTPITYMPLLFSYSGSLADPWGSTSLSLGLNLLVRGLVSDDAEVRDERFKARGNYIYLRGGLERVQKLPLNTALFVKLDGQIADQPLVSNEQYSAGGMENVRGYHESEFAGDDALHATLELTSANLDRRLSSEGWGITLSPYLFYDAAWLRVQEPLPDQQESEFLHGAGIGSRLSAGDWLRAKFDLGAALSDTAETEAPGIMGHFRLEYRF